MYFARPSLWQPSTWWNSEQSTIEALCLADVIRPFDVSNKFLIRRNSVWIKQHYLRWVKKKGLKKAHRLHKFAEITSLVDASRSIIFLLIVYRNIGFGKRRSETNDGGNPLQKRLPVEKAHPRNQFQFLLLLFSFVLLSSYPRRHQFSPGPEFSQQMFIVYYCLLPGLVLMRVALM